MLIYHCLLEAASLPGFSRNDLPLESCRAVVFCALFQPDFAGMYDQKRRMTT